MPIHHEVISKCPFCGAAQALASTFDEDSDPPKAGDTSFCSDCGAWAIFTGNGSETRKPTSTEYNEINADPELRRLRNVWLLQQQQEKRH